MRPSFACLLLAARASALTAGPRVVTPGATASAPALSAVSVRAPAVAPGFSAAEAVLTDLSGRYAQLAQDYFLPVAALQSGVLRGVADVVAHRDSVDPAHTTAIFLLAFFVSGLGNAMWLRRLETMYGTGTEPATLARKTATDYSVWAPFANSAYLLGVPLLTGHDVAAALSTLQSGFLSVMLMELCIFAPYNLFAFRSISLNLRPAVSAVLAFAFTIGLSSQC